jgi:hypothetical protein
MGTRGPFTELPVPCYGHALDPNPFCFNFILVVGLRIALQAGPRVFTLCDGVFSRDEE